MGSHDTTGSRRVRVTFKPKGVKPVEAGDLREVVFTTDGELPDGQVLFHNALAEAVEQGVISQYAAREHWEPYKHELLD